MIGKLEKEIEEIDLAMMADQSDYESLNKLYAKKEELSKELELVMEQWVSLED